MQTMFHRLVMGLVFDIIGLYWSILTSGGHYWLALGGPVGSARDFRYQHVCIYNVTFSRRGSRPTRGPTQVVFRWSGI